MARQLDGHRAVERGRRAERGDVVNTAVGLRERARAAAGEGEVGAVDHDEGGGGAMGGMPGGMPGGGMGGMPGMM